MGTDGWRSNVLRFSGAPASARLIDPYWLSSKNNDLDRHGRGVGWMRMLGRRWFAARPAQVS